MSMTRDELWAAYGRPEQVDVARALDALGLGVEDTKNFLAFRYPHREAADAYAEANRENYGHKTIGSYTQGPAGIVAVLDISAAVAEADAMLAEQRGVPH